MTRLAILILRDRLPGHYRQSEGIADALKLFAELHIDRIEVRKRRWIPQRTIRALLNRGLVSPLAALNFLYGINGRRLDRPDIIVSAGGDTLIANVALAMHFGCKNVFSGSIRSLNHKFFSAIIHNYGHAGHANEIIALTPAPAPEGITLVSGVTPPTLGPGVRVTLMIGGPSPSHRYTQREWRALFDFAAQTSSKEGWLWTIVTSRRTPRKIADAAIRLVGAGVNISVIDFRVAGPDSASAAFRSADIVLVTEDSNSMISEAISALKPTVTLAPRARSQNPKDREILQHVYDRGWAGRLSISEPSFDGLANVLRHVRPPDEWPLMTLARGLRRVLRLEDIPKAPKPLRRGPGHR